MILSVRYLNPNPNMTTASTELIQYLPAAHIEPDPAQPRKEFDPAYIADLGESIAAEGLLQPITVRAHPDKPGCFLIVTGECRWRAHCFKGIQSVKCIVTEQLEDDARRGRVQLMENMKRRDMSLREEAFGIERQSQLGDTDEQLAASLGMTKARVSILRRMTKLPQTIWTMLEMGALAPGTVESAVSKLPAGHIEGALIRCAGKNINQAAVILLDYELNLRQDDFALALEEAGVAQKKGEIGQTLARQLMAVAQDIEKLSAADRSDFARVIGNDIAAAVALSKRNKAAAGFLALVFTRLNVVMTPTP